MAGEWMELKGNYPPEGLVVETKIDEGGNCRNEQKLKRIGNLWFVPDGENYVYYTPTHWKNCTPYYFLDVFGERAKDCFTSEPMDSFERAQGLASYWIKQEKIERINIFFVNPDGSMRKEMELKREKN